MARRADHTREELTELALSTAIQMIDAEGLSGFSARGLAKAIGYTVGTVSNVFGGADALLLHINGRTLDEWHAALTRAMGKKRGAVALQALAGAYLAFGRQHPHRWALLFDGDRQTAVPPWYQAKLDAFFGLVETALQTVPGAARRDTAHVLWAGIHGVCVLERTHKLDLTGAHTADALARQFITTYLKGLA